MLHYTFKLGCFLGIATLLMVQLSDGFLHKLHDFHKNGRPSGAVKPLEDGNKDLLIEHFGHDENHGEDLLNKKDNYDPKIHEMDYRKAQNLSLCKYTVIPIPNPGGRLPKELNHIKCNEKGFIDQGKHSYCCIQIYRYVEVMYEDGRTEKMKVYDGCNSTLLNFCSSKKWLH